MWFDNKAQEAVKFYVSLFPDSEIGTITRYGKSGAKASGMSEGSIMTISFKINGQDFMALNGGPIFKFTEAVSFIVNCETQEEIDKYWEKLSEGGEESVCGWLKDKYGLSWQVSPAILEEMADEKDPEKWERVMEKMMNMKKIDIKALEDAYKS